ncbi:MAG: hypothetical protein H7145_11455 [Akkermansiaceae bacterium]|nr:hypothetical protein [Armatimonadota bacterium]
MAFSRLYACDTCEAGEAVLTFAETWGADSSESAPSPYPGFGNVQGLFSMLWCRTCRAVRPCILLRLQPPAAHAVVAYAEAQRQGLTGYEAGVCQECQGALIASGEGEPCPVCAIGTLRLIGEWEDAA